MRDFARKILADVPVGREFVLVSKGNRIKLRNLLDLKVELEQITARDFSHHVTANKNDFASWVNDILDDTKLANDLKSVSTKDEMLSLLRSRINFAVSIIEKENQRLLKDEVKRIKVVSMKEKSPSLKQEIETLSKDVERVSKNINLENKILNTEEDMTLVPLSQLPPVPATARVVEFLLGFSVGLMLGLLIARAIFGL